MFSWPFRNRRRKSATCAPLTSQFHFLPFPRSSFRKSREIPSRLLRIGTNFYYHVLGLFFMTVIAAKQCIPILVIRCETIYLWCSALRAIFVRPWADETETDPECRLKESSAQAARGRTIFSRFISLTPLSLSLSLPWAWAGFLDMGGTSRTFPSLSHTHSGGLFSSEMLKSSPGDAQKIFGQGGEKSLGVLLLLPPAPFIGELLEKVKREERAFSAKHGGCESSSTCRELVRVVMSTKKHGVVFVP